MADPVPVLYNIRPTAAQVRRTAYIALALFFALLLTLPFRNIQLANFSGFPAAVYALEVFGGLVTAILLFFQAQITRSMALMALGTAFFYFAVMVFVSLLTFAGTFSDSGLLGAGLSTSSWLNWFCQLGFLTGVIAYALLNKYPDWACFTALQPRQIIVVCIAGAMALVAALVVLTTIGEPLLPKLLLDKTHRNVTVVNYFQMSLGIPAIIAIGCIWRSYRSVLDLWLLLSLFTWLLATVLFVSFSARYTLGWYALLLLNLTSNLTILTMQLSETGRLFARFICHTFAMEHEHERQLLIREAAAASIAHELKQPIAEIMLNAWVGQMGALRDDQSTCALFKEIEEAGRRANDTIQSTRSLFAHSPAAMQASDVNELIRKSLDLVSQGLKDNAVSVDLKLGDSLPPVAVNQLQMQEVFLNLFTNAMEAMDGQTGKPRMLTISSSRADAGVVIRVQDTGPGITSEEAEQIFTPFHTTKKDGTGVGLTICQSIVSAHAGSLHVISGNAEGAAFEVVLPCRGARVSAEVEHPYPSSSAIPPSGALPLGG